MEYDAENRRKWTGKPPAPAPFRIEPDAVTQEVIDMVEEHLSDHFGSSDDFHFAVTAADAEQALEHFINYALPCFGDYQDAISDHKDWLFHSILSPYINCCLLYTSDAADDLLCVDLGGR